MNFDLDETQESLRGLASDLFERRVDPARIEKVEALPDRFDRELWTALADAGLLGVAVPESAGGLGFGAVEVFLVLEQLGRAVAPVPLVDALLTGWLLAEQAPDDVRSRWLSRIVGGSAIAAVAAPASTVGVTSDGAALSGTAIGVPWAHVADVLVLPVGDDVFLVEPAGVDSERAETTAREIALNLQLAATPATRLPGAADWLRLRTRVALAAVSAGVTDAALRLTASYTSERHQFDKPLSTFQAVALKAADAYLDATAIRAAALQAAWAVDHQPDPRLAALTAAWWAAEAGQRAVHITQHLHGGMGADITYPVHRYFLWGKQIELLLGGASALLAELGDVLDASPEAGDAVSL